ITNSDLGAPAPWPPRVHQAVTDNQSTPATRRDQPAHYVIFDVTPSMNPERATQSGDMQAVTACHDRHCPRRAHEPASPPPHKTDHAELHGIAASRPAQSAAPPASSSPSGRVDLTHRRVGWEAMDRVSSTDL